MTREEYFSKTEFDADYVYWRKMEYWQVDEGVALLLGKDPSRVNWGMMEGFANRTHPPPLFAVEYAGLRELAHRKWTTVQQWNFRDIVHVIPTEFLDWAKGIDIEIPQELEKQYSPQVISSDPLTVFRNMDALEAKEISLEFVDIDQMVVSARGESKRVPLSSLDLIDRRTGDWNMQAALLQGLALGKKIPEGKAQTVSRVRCVFKKLGVTDAPFQKDKKPHFAIADGRGKEDRRAQNSAVHVEYDDQATADTHTFDDEDDDAGRWLKEPH